MQVTICIDGRNSLYSIYIALFPEALGVAQRDDGRTPVDAVNPIRANDPAAGDSQSAGRAGLATGPDDACVGAIAAGATNAGGSAGGMESAANTPGIGN